MKPSPSHQALAVLRTFSTGDRVCTAHLAAAKVLDVNAENGQVTVRRARDGREETVDARGLIKITGTIGNQVPA